MPPRTREELQAVVRAFRMGEAFQDGKRVGPVEKNLKRSPAAPAVLLVYSGSHFGSTTPMAPINISLGCELFCDMECS